MSLPGPAAFARRCLASLARRPAAALAPYLNESYPERPTLSEEALTIAAGAGSFVVVAATTALALALSAVYALLYVTLRSLGRAGTRLASGAAARLGR
ncbi:hypothetical protein J2752_000064 [Halarchaeum rubridurum]|uniref:Uncharacterized protein n=1 Tax=Halarchaeum rubridurum TaxID=489911 RepID=A0A830FYI8_9EURY|nr:hypothetical protein [Halarchaeum rubridurum]MBP1953183.1 hypothetical protein [Halarchaeum rubridurum]GGM67203.1 hypothetical protein GCM10009017_16720 [Halarchaeum rubridurum]